MTLLRLPFILSTLTAFGTLPSPAEGQTISRVSVNSSGVQGDRWSGGNSISADGRYIAFVSDATNLVTGDRNADEDVFVLDRVTGAISCASVNLAGHHGDSHSRHVSLSADGRYVAFYSYAENLVPGDSNDEEDVFVHDRQSGMTRRASVDSAGGQANGRSIDPTITADGRCVVFSSLATNLVPGDTNGYEDIFVHDLITGQTHLASVGLSGVTANSVSFTPSISADGHYVTFSSYATNLVPGDTNQAHDIFVYDRQAALTSRVSVDSAGAEANSTSLFPLVSADGRTVVFWSRASNLVAGDTNGLEEVFLHDRQTGLTTRVSVDSHGAQADGMSAPNSLSLNGRFVLFDSYATNLVANDVNGTVDVFLHDRVTGTTRLLSVNAAGAQGNGRSGGLTISADHRHLVFWSDSSNLVPGDTNHCSDVFVLDLISPGPELVASGSCPGPITLNVSNATANGFVTFLYGPPRVWVHTTLPCLGLVLGVNPPAIATRIRADGSGTASVNLMAPAGLCALNLQAVDQASCTPTSVITL